MCVCVCACMCAYVCKFYDTREPTTYPLLAFPL